MSEMLFPERQRCKTCRRALGLRPQDPVLMGLYCSPRCAKLAAPARRPEDAPRECVTMREGRWVWKRRYRSLGEVPDKIRDDPSTSWYWCGHCGHGHYGHTRAGEAERFRMFDPRGDLVAELGELLVKLRGGATRAQVAAVAGIRPIRLKELEEGIAHPLNLQSLTRVLSVYRVRLGVALPTSAAPPRRH